MFTIRKILVPVDYSSHSERALAYAADFAAAFVATLHVVHVYPAQMYLAPPMVAVPLLLDQFRNQSKTEFDQYLARAIGKYSTSITGALLEGTPEIEIIAAAKEMHADLIVMGTHGRTGLDHLLLGSVAERVIRRSEAPVITVPEPRSRAS